MTAPTHPFPAEWKGSVEAQVGLEPQREKGEPEVAMAKQEGEVLLPRGLHR